MQAKGEAFLNIFFAGSFLALSVSCIFTEREGSISRYHCLISTDGSVFFSSFSFCEKTQRIPTAFFSARFGRMNPWITNIGSNRDFREYTLQKKTDNNDNK